MKRHPSSQWVGLVTLLLAGACAEPLLDAPPELYPSNHQDVQIQADGTTLPLVIGAGRSFGYCFAAALTQDTSQWVADLVVDRHLVGAEKPPRVAFANTVCFEVALPTDLTEGRHRLCSRITDRYDGRRSSQLCFDFAALRSTAARDALEARLTQIVKLTDRPTSERLEQLDRVAGDAASAGLPALAVRVGLVATYLLRREGDAASLAAANERMSRLPTWLSTRPGAWWRRYTSHEAAELALPGNPLLAWKRLAECDAIHRVLISPLRLVVVLKQAVLLAEAGSPDEATRRLLDALEGCTRDTCDETMKDAALTALAWSVAQSSTPDPGDVRRAERLLEQALRVNDGSGDPVERANSLVNLAWLRVGSNRSMTELLDEAERRLATQRGDGRSRAAILMQWVRLLRGLAALEAGQSMAARQLCDGVVKIPSLPVDLASRALGCRGLALCRDQRLQEGTADLLHAVAHDAVPAANRAEGGARSIPLYEADYAYEAAGALVTLQRVDAAWDLLQTFDAATFRGSAGSQPSQSALFRTLLATLSAPTHAAAKARRTELLRQTALELDRVTRDAAATTVASTELATRSARLVAFPTANEVIVLERPPRGPARLRHRFSIARRELAEAISRLTATAVETTIDRQRWNADVQQLRNALDLPTGAGTDTSVGLYGVLQHAPLALLSATMPDQSTAGLPWIANRSTRDTVWPAARDATTPLLIVDPLGNLPHARALVPELQRLFPQAATLSGSAATSDAVIGAVDRAAWLHIDSHGRFDAAFPELSQLLMSDGPLLAQDLAAKVNQLAFVNLSACSAARAPVTAGRGRFGFAGQLIRAGVPWVIASTTDLDDQVAAAFNREFYRTYATTRSVPLAFAAGIRGLVNHPFPPWKWGALVLLGRDSNSGGQSVGAGTPLQREVRPDDDGRRSSDGR